MTPLIIYRSKFDYVKSQDNIIADFFSQNSLSEGKEALGLYVPAEAPAHMQDANESRIMEGQEFHAAYYFFSTILNDQVF